MNTRLLDAEVQRYVDAVAAALADLPDATRADVLEDLAEHLGEFDLANGSLESQVGDPVTYAHELRASAGLAAAEAPSIGSTDPLADLVGTVRRGARRVRSTAWWNELAQLVPELRPAWWVFRAWFVLAIFDLPIRDNVPLPRLTDGLGGPLGFVVRLTVFGAAVIWSARLGRRQLAGRRRALGVGLTIAGALAGFSMLAQSSDTSSTVYESEPPYGQLAIDDAGRRMQPVMVFDEAGRLLPQRQLALVDAAGTVIAAQGERVRIDGALRDLVPCTDDKSWALCVSPGAPVPTVGGATRPDAPSPTGGAPTSVPATPLPPSTSVVPPSTTQVAPTTTAG